MRDKVHRLNAGWPGDSELPRQVDIIEKTKNIAEDDAAREVFNRPLYQHDPLHLFSSFSSTHLILLPCTLTLSHLRVKQMI